VLRGEKTRSGQELRSSGIVEIIEVMVHCMIGRRRHDQMLVGFLLFDDETVKVIEIAHLRTQPYTHLPYFRLMTRDSQETPKHVEPQN
jgi:hypothetical protein